MNLVDRAMKMALKHHFGVANKHDGEPYVLHLQRVYIMGRDQGHDEVQQAIAWLHDIIEDTDCTLRDIQIEFMLDFHSLDRIISGVDGITHRKGESNEDYFYRCARNKDSRAVKKNDLADNFGRNHMIEDDEKRLRMASKYSLGIDIMNRVR